MLTLNVNGLFHNNKMWWVFESLENKKAVINLLQKTNWTAELGRKMAKGCKGYTLCVTQTIKQSPQVLPFS